MTMKRITLQLARNPGLPVGDAGQGYTVFAPLTEDGHLDVESWREHRAECRIVKFHPNPDERATGVLTHRGSKWMFHYDDEDNTDDEAGYKLGEHLFKEGEYITISSFGAEDLTYKVTDVSPVE